VGGEGACGLSARGSACGGGVGGAPAEVGSRRTLGGRELRLTGVVWTGRRYLRFDRAGEGFFVRSITRTTTRTRTRSMRVQRGRSARRGREPAYAGRQRIEATKGDMTAPSTLGRPAAGQPAVGTKDVCSGDKTVARRWPPRFFTPLLILCHPVSSDFFRAPPSVVLCRSLGAPRTSSRTLRIEWHPRKPLK